MTGEHNLTALLRHMKPELQPDIFVFCTIPTSEPIPTALNPLLTFREQEGVTLVISREEAEAAGPGRQWWPAAEGQAQEEEGLAAVTDEAPLVEAEGETVGEAKWMALRELERRYPGLARDAVSFQVVSEGERGLLGVGTSPARVVATFDPAVMPAPEAAPEPVPAGDEGDHAMLVRELLDRIAAALGANCRVDVADHGASIKASLTGSDVAVLIGKRGKTIDAIQYLVGAAVATASGDAAPRVTVDAAGYRDRREARLVDLADRSADQVVRSGRTIRLEPMTSTERKIVHMRLKDSEGIETHSEGDEPNRYVVISPAAD